MKIANAKMLSSFCASHPLRELLVPLRAKKLIAFFLFSFFALKLGLTSVFALMQFFFPNGFSRDLHGSPFALVHIVHSSLAKRHE